MKDRIILLLENDEDDVFFFRRALKALNYDGKLHVVEDTSRARAYLDGTEPFQDRSHFPLPDLIVSDMKLYGETGAQFHAWLRANPPYAGIPFVLFTDTSRVMVGVDLVQAGARAYVTKSANFDEMKKSVQDILQFLPASNSPARGRSKSKPPRSG